MECYSCSSHSVSSECYSGLFSLDSIEKITCSGINTCQKINNLNGLCYMKNLKSQKLKFNFFLAAGDVVTVMRQCALVRCSFIGANCYECEGDLCNSAASISKSVLLGLSALIIAFSFQKLMSS